MVAPTCAVSTTLYRQDGAPDQGAVVTAKLNSFEVDSGLGYIVPKSVRVTADAAGLATLNLWPNELGSVESAYEITIRSSDGRVLKTTAVVPNAGSITLEACAVLPEYPGKVDGQIAADAAAVSAGQAATSAAAAAADRVQTGLDRVQTSSDRTQTGADLVAANAARDTAIAQASLAAGYAASAGSVVQQDLSGVTAAALHRSPNAVVATALYDTSADRAGGAWVDRPLGASWLYETLNGTWLGAHASETAARGAVGAGTGAYYQLTTDGKFYRLNKNRLAHAADLTQGAWVKAGTTVTSKTAGDGVGDKVIPSVANTTHTVQQAKCFAGAQNTITVRAKAAEYVWMAVDGGNGGASYVNLATGTNGNVAAGWTVTSSAVTGSPGYFDFVFTGTPTATSFVIYVATANASPSFAGDGVSGILVAQVQIATDATPGFETKAVPADAEQSETFRGNKAKFPRQVAIVAEASRVVIYDLTEPGRPMWMVVASSGVTGNALLNWFGVNPGLSSVAAREGCVVIGGSSTCPFLILDFPRDDVRLGTVSGFASRLRMIGDRQKSGHGAITSGGGIVIVHNTVNAVAMTTMPDAPLDPATGLAVPTIAVFTAGGISLIQHDGTVRNSSSAGAFATGSLTPKLLTAAQSSNANFYFASDPSKLGAAFALTTISAGTAQMASLTPTGAAVANRSLMFRRGGAVLDAVHLNESTPTASLAARITDTGNTGWMCGDIRRALMCDTAPGVLSAANIVVNGEFATDITGWTRNGLGTQTWVAGALRSDSTAGAGGSYEDLPTTVGVTYSLTATYANVSGAGVTQIAAYQGGAFTALYGVTGVSGDPIVFTAATTSVRVYLATAAGRVADFDNVNLVPVVADRSYKAKPAQVVGTLTKTAVAAGAQLVAYSGFSAANYVREAYSADLDFGTGGFRVSAWVSIPAIGTQFILDRSAAAGAFFQLYVDSTGKLVANMSDGTTSRSATSTASYNGAGWIKVAMEYATSGALTLRVNGAQVAQTTGAPLLTMSNAAAVLTIGNDRTLAGPFGGSVALVRMGATLMPAEQGQFAYAQERQMFREGAQVTLPDSGALVDISYDERLGALYVASAANESRFDGLVRTAVTAVAAGSYSKVSAASGLKLVARTTTNPGVDVTLPPQNLREELLRREEAVARLPRLQPFDFDAVTAQTDFTLAVGWEAAEVMTAGSSKREGTTKDWTRKFDGFRETVSFNVAPGNTVWVQVVARRTSP